MLFKLVETRRLGFLIRRQFCSKTNMYEYEASTQSRDVRASTARWVGWEGDVVEVCMT